MSILANLLGQNRVHEKRDGWDVIVEAKKESATEINVTPESSLRMTAVFAAVSLLADTIGSLPLITYERQEKGRRKATDHYLYPILHDSPNEMMTAIEFRSTMQGYVALRGNAIAQIEYDDRGRVTELWPLRWENVHELKVDQRTGRILYYYLTPDNYYQWIASDKVWHLRGWGSDGVIGYNPISLARRAVGLGMAAEEFGARFFGNDARPGIVMEHPGKLGPEAQKNLKDSWEEGHKGLSKSHRIAILEEGMKLHEVGIPPEDAQFLETRKFQVNEIARLFRVPPHMIGDLEKATFSNIEHQGIQFVTYSLQSWMTRWEQSIKKNLLLPTEREIYYVEHLVDSLLRGDTSTRYQAYAVGINSGWFTRADAREKENLEPIDGLEDPLVPMNMMVLGESGENDSSPQRAQRAQSSDGDKEERTQRSVNARRRIMLAQRQVMEELMKRLYRREINDIRPIAKRMIPAGMEAEFSTWLEKFYKDHRKWTAEQALKTFRAYMQMIAGAAEDETGKPLEAERLEGFAKSYTESFSDRQAAHSEERIRALLDEEDALDAMEEEFENWQDVRPGRSAGGEVVQQANAISKLVYVAAGVTMLRWVSSGQSCPYCDSLDGMTVGINQSFLVKGETWQPEGAEAPLEPSVDVGHPPAHEGCDCMIAAG